MIDTIKLVIELNEPPVYRYNPAGATGYANFGVLNTAIKPARTKKEIKKMGLYLPRITFVDRPTRRLVKWKSFAPEVIKGYVHEMRVECSLPKLVFGNNFSELSDKDFPEAVEQLKDMINLTLRLSKIPMADITTKQIESAQVSRLDVGKNVPFYSGVKPWAIIDDFKLARIPKPKQFSIITYSGGGTQFILATKKTRNIIYDKIAELKNEKSRASGQLEKDGWIQFDLLDKLQANKNLSIVRVESQIKDAAELRRKLKRIGRDDKDRSFKTIFSSSLSRDLLKLFFDELVAGLPEDRPKLRAKDKFREFSKTDKRPNPLFARIGYSELEDEVGDSFSFREMVEGVVGYENARNLRERYGGSSVKPFHFKEIQEIAKAINEMKPIDIEEVIRNASA